MTAALRVLDPGPLLLVQDAGRPGLLGQGVTGSGFADGASARRANRLVGNPEGAAVLEGLLGPIALVAEGASALVAVGGVLAVVEVVVDGVAHGHTAEEPVAVPAGAALRIAVPASGLRPMIAVRGGVAVAGVLGSRSRDTLSRIGPPPLAAGDRVPIGDEALSWPAVDLAVVAPPPSPGEVLDLPFRPGPRDDRLTEEGRRALREPRVVSARGDRVGVRLDGPPIDARAGAIPSEPTVAGAIELPTDGVPFVLGRDHPVTVGYPVVGVVEPAALDRLAQARPGAPVRLVPVG